MEVRSRSSGPESLRGRVEERSERKTANGCQDCTLFSLTLLFWTLLSTFPLLVSPLHTSRVGRVYSVSSPPM